MSELITHTLDYWSAGGLLLLPLAVVSLGIWGFFLRSRDRLVLVSREARDLEQNLSATHLDATSSETPLEVFLSRVRADMDAGVSPRHSFHTRGDQCLESLRQDLILLTALTAVAPLMGLLGTVVGMVDTFDAVAGFSGNTGGEVAGGISQALITTQVGLIVAVPGVFGVSRLRKLLRDVEAALGALRAKALNLIESPIREAA